MIDTFFKPFGNEIDGLPAWPVFETLVGVAHPRRRHLLRRRDPRPRRGCRGGRCRRPARPSSARRSDPREAGAAARRAIAAPSSSVEAPTNDRRRPARAISATSSSRPCSGARAGRPRPDADRRSAAASRTATSWSPRRDGASATSSGSPATTPISWASAARSSMRRRSRRRRRRRAGGHRVHPAGGLPRHPVHRGSPVAIARCASRTRSTASPIRCGGSTAGRPSRACSCRSGSSRRTGPRHRPRRADPARVRARRRRSAAGSSWPAWPRRSSCGRATTTCSTPTSSTTVTRIRIVDWEYAGMGDPFFDLGNFSINHELTPRGRRILLAAYDGSCARPPARPADPDARGVRLPRGDVGRPPAGHQHARRRLRRVRGRALRPAAGERLDAGLRAVACARPPSDRAVRSPASVAARRPEVAEVDRSPG